MVLPFLGLCLILRNAVALEVHQLNDNWTVISQNQSEYSRQSLRIANGFRSKLLNTVWQMYWIGSKGYAFF